MGTLLFRDNYQYRSWNIRDLGEDSRNKLNGYGVSLAV